jgi:hypothetical protein
MITNTCHFVSISAAERYYSRQTELFESCVREALREGRIFIGAPKYDPMRQSIRVYDGRYQIIDCEGGYRVGDLHG